MLFAILLLSPFAASLARAQVVPSVLEDVRLVTEDAESSTFMLRFSPAEPRVADNNSDPARPDVIMATTLRAGRVAARQTYRGLVRTMIFTDQGGSLVVRFETALPASVKSERMGNNAVQIKVARVTDEERLGSRRGFWSKVRRSRPTTSSFAANPASARPRRTSSRRTWARSSRRSAIRCRWGRTWATALPSTGG